MNGISKVVIAMAFAGTCFAQSAALPVPPEPKYFKLEFTVKELDGGKLINSRKYVTSIGTDRDSSSIRSGDKVPVRSATGFNYTDVGVNIDCHNARETANGLALNVTGDISNTVPLPEGNTAPPIMRSNRWGGMVLAPLKKPTLVFSSDDPTTNRQMQLELVATLLP